MKAWVTWAYSCWQINAGRKMVEGAIAGAAEVEKTRIMC